MKPGSQLIRSVVASALTNKTAATQDSTKPSSKKLHSDEHPTASRSPINTNRQGVTRQTNYMTPLKSENIHYTQYASTLPDQ